MVFESVKDHIRALDQRIVDCLHHAEPLIQETIQPYILSQGKRIRPALVYLSALNTCSAVSDECHRYAMAMELIHAASLFHDDVLDNALNRRGRPAANRLHGNDTAVLLGDFLYMTALSLLETDRIQERRAVHRAVTAMTQAEIYQGLKRYTVLTEHEYNRIIQGKTAELISLCAYLGASVSRNRQWTSGLAEFGRVIGIAFQMIDDVLDWTAGSETGKDRFGDIREGRVTLPLIKLLAVLHPDEKHNCVKELLQPGSSPSPAVIEKYAIMMQSSGVIKEIEQEAGRLQSKASEILHQLPMTPYRQDMIEFSRWIVDRSR